MFADQSPAIRVRMIFLLVGGFVCFCTSPVVAQTPALHAKWEYKVVEFYARDKTTEHTKKLNELAAHGWEYVGLIHPLDDGGGRFATKSAVAFRRERRTTETGSTPPNSENTVKSSEMVVNRGYVKQKPSKRVHDLRFADAAKVGAILSGLKRPNVRLEVDRRTNQIVIEATEPQHQEFSALIEQLDSQERSESLAVIPLRQIDPKDAMLILRKTLVGGQEEAPKIEADLEGRRLLIRGSAAQLRQIKNLIAGLEWLIESNSARGDREPASENRRSDVQPK